MSPRGLAAVPQVTDDTAYLYELIRTIGSGPDLDSILRGIVHLVTQAVACHACFIYLRSGEALELRVASSAYRRLEDRVRIPVGEGLTGWAAKTRQSAYIRDHALEDPRVRRATFPELGDEAYQSLVSVPILARDGDVIGVITLHAEAPHEFARSDVDFLEHTASLTAGALENARLYETATTQVALLTDLSRLSRKVASAANQTEVLARVTEGVHQLLTANRCAILLLEPDGRLSAAASQPSSAPGRPIDVRTLWPDDLDEGDGSEGSLRLGASLWGDAPGVSLVSPLVAGEERLGVLAVLLPAASPDAASVLAAVAAHTAVALKQHEVIESLREKNLVKDFFQALVHPGSPVIDVRELAGRLGCSPDAPHLVLHIVPWVSRRKGAGGRDALSANGRASIGWRDRAGQTEARLAARFPGLLFDRLERSIRALVPIDEPGEEGTIALLRSMDWGTADTGALSVGVSSLAIGPDAFRVAFEEASSAAEIGALIRGEPGVSTYDDLGPYRYVLASEEGGRDRLQQRLEPLVEYDRRRGTQLLETLEGFLDHRGNVVATSRVLYIHPNTLRQRMDRIQRVSGIVLENEDWLSLAVATKAVKLRRMRRSV